MSGIRDHAIYEMTIEFQQEIREQVSQDESNHVGYQQATKVLHVIAPTKEIAIGWLQSGTRIYAYSGAVIKSIVERPIAAFIEQHIY